MKKLVLVVVVLAAFMISGCVATIYESATKGNLSAIRSHVASTKDPNYPDEYGTTLLHNAGTSEVIRYLVVNGADVNAKTNRGGTPLSYIVWQVIGADDELLDGIKFLLDRGAEPGPGMEKLASMWTFDRKNDYRVAKKLADMFAAAGASFDFVYNQMAKNIEDTVSQMGKSIGVSVITIEPEFISYVASKGLLDLNQTDSNGNTLLHKAAFQNNLNQAKYLVSLGAIPSIKNDEGQTADDIFARYSRLIKKRKAEIAEEERRRAEERRREEIARKKRNAFLRNALASAAMGAAIHDAGGTADRAVQTGMATYQDLSNGTTSNMQGLADQYNQQAKEAEASNMASIRQGQDQLDREYNQWEQQQKAKTASYNNCVNRGGKWIDGQCYMPSGSQSKTYKQNTQSSSYSSAGSQYASSSTNRPGNGSTSSKKKMIDCKPITDACMMRKVGFNTIDEQKSYMWGKCGKRNEGALYGDTKWNSCRDNIYKKASDARRSCAGEVTKMLRADNARCIGATAMAD